MRPIGSAAARPAASAPGTEPMSPSASAALPRTVGEASASAAVSAARRRCVGDEAERERRHLAHFRIASASAPVSGHPLRETDAAHRHRRTPAHARLGIGDEGSRCYRRRSGRLGATAARRGNRNRWRALNRSTRWSSSWSIHAIFCWNVVVGPLTAAGALAQSRGGSPARIKAAAPSIERPGHSGSEGRKKSVSRSYDCGDAPAEIDVHDDGCHLETVRRDGSGREPSGSGTMLSRSHRAFDYTSP